MKINFAGTAAGRIVQVGPVHQDHQVSVLFDSTGFAKVRQLRTFVGALLRPAVELGQRHHRRPKLLGDQLDLPGELRHLDLTRLDPTTRAHQPQVVDDDQPRTLALLQPARFGPDLGSWLNFVVVWFGIIEPQAMRRGVFPSVHDLTGKIRNFITGWNRRKHPFIWTKTPDQILTKIKRKQTSSASH